MEVLAILGVVASIQQLTSFVLEAIDRVKGRTETIEISRLRIRIVGTEKLMSEIIERSRSRSQLPENINLALHEINWELIHARDLCDRLSKHIVYRVLNYRDISIKLEKISIKLDFLLISVSTRLNISVYDKIKDLEAKLDNFCHEMSSPIKLLCELLSNRTISRKKLVEDMRWMEGNKDVVGHDSIAILNSPAFSSFLMMDDSTSDVYKPQSTLFQHSTSDVSSDRHHRKPLCPISVSNITNSDRGNEELKNWAKNGVCDSQFYLAKCYELGDNMPKDFGMAIAWYHESHCLGHPEAMTARNRLANIIPKIGSVLNQVGNYFFHGIEVGKDYKKALYWFNEAMEKEDIDACYNVGECYFHGHGVEKNYHVAVEYYIQAADRKHPRAIFSLAGCYTYGHGVEMNKSKAKFYLRQVVPPEKSD